MRSACVAELRAIAEDYRSGLILVGNPFYWCEDNLRRRCAENLAWWANQASRQQWDLVRR